MRILTKPERLHPGDKVAAVSPCNGWAGDPDVYWKYKLGIDRLRELELEAVSAPNSLRGSDFLSKNPQARAEDIMWAFENQEIRAVIANIGGNDSIKIIPYINPSCISNNPKIFIGYSDVMNLHLLCYKCGLSSFYGDNLLNPIAEQSKWHEYSKKWFIKTLFDSSTIGMIEPSSEWSFEEPDYQDPNEIRKYINNEGYSLIQGKGKARGRLIGGHTGIMELEGTSLELSKQDFEDTILFIEDIPEFFNATCIETFFRALGRKGILQNLKGIVIGKTAENECFFERSEIIRYIMREYNCGIPILYGLNFGHSSPIFILPYGAMAEIDCSNLTFSILENGVI